MPQKKIIDKGAYLVDEKFMGTIGSDTVALIMDNVIDRDKRKPRVKMMYTSNVSLLAGQDTVAVFRKKVYPSADEPCPDCGELKQEEGQCDCIVEAPKPEKVEAKVVTMDGDVTSLFINHINKINMKKANKLYRDPGTKSDEPAAEVKEASQSGQESVGAGEQSAGTEAGAAE